MSKVTNNGKMVQKMIYMTNPKTLRFYWLNIQQDLFGTWCMHKIYGGLTNHRGREVWLPFETKSAASKALTDAEYLKRQRGYIYSDIADVEHFALKPQTINEVLASKKCKVIKSDMFA